MCDNVGQLDRAQKLQTGEAVAQNRGHEAEAQAFWGGVLYNSREV
jgi:hypothetical protein